MTITLPELKKWFNKHKTRIREDYFRFLRFPSISADPAYHADCLRCAEWLIEHLKKGNLHAERIETPTLPIVYAQDLSAGANRPTVLLYGHYDVQPPDPVELWKSPPFEPAERDGSIYARGASDDKGQIFYAVCAVQCWKDLGRPLPVNIKFCIEGEEEFSSRGLSEMLPSLKTKLKADHLLVVDFNQFDPDIPAVSLGTRGLVALEVTLTGSNSDLHSGMYGGIAYNPNRALIELLARLWDAEGRVQVPGFYEGITDPTAEELNTFEKRHEKDYYTRHFGIEAFGGEKGKSLHEANCFRPTLEINGIVGGYTGAGIKTVIPASSHAKITGRLVPGQDPQKITTSIAEFLKRHAVPGMKVEIKTHKGEPAFRSKADSKLAKAVAAAAEEVTGNRCRFLTSGASIPIIPDLMRSSGASATGMGYGLDGDAIHAPNEHFDMHRFEQGFLTVGRALSLI
jgi:acetylornithine deacetylase/succinyl-diaminopimelate desuccinylase-like protein